MLKPSRRRRPEIDRLETRQLLAASTIDPAPQVASVQFLPLTGRVQFTITEAPSGIDPSRLTDPANYTFAPIATADKPPARDPSRPGAGMVLAPNEVVTGVSLTPNPAPGLPQLVTVIINNNQPIRPGSYRFAIRSAGIVDARGVPLDGAYLGVFPSGNGRPGTDFAARLSTVDHSVRPARPASPLPPGPPTPGASKPAPVSAPTTVDIRIKIVGNNNRTSRTLGGGNAFAVALPGQGFPDTFHLPGITKGKHRR